MILKRCLKSDILLLGSGTWEARAYFIINLGLASIFENNIGPMKLVNLVRWANEGFLFGQVGP